MICVGIDAASMKHDVCIANDKGVQFGKVFTIKNTKDDYEKLLGRIQAAKEYFNDADVRLGIESTGSYSAVLTEYLAGRDGLEVILINPILTNRYQQIRKVHYAKTDTIDAAGIAAYVASNPNVRTYTPPSYHLRALKEMYRDLVTLNKNITESKNKLKAALHRYFPEYLSVFSCVSSKASLCILMEYRDPRRLLKRKPETIRRSVNGKSGGHRTIKKAQELQQAVKNTVGNRQNYSGIVLKNIAERIVLFQKQKEELVSSRKPLVEEEAPELLTIPGISTILAAGIISEIISIANFQNADQLVAYAGLDPIVYESGTYKARNTRISKKGSAYLRDALYYASFCVSQRDEVFHAYYQKKISEGKKHRVVLGHISKKLCRLIFRLLTTHKGYVPRPVGKK